MTLLSLAYRLLLLLTLAFLSRPMYSQVVETIRENPEFRTLRSIWKVTGVNSGDRVGDAIGQFVDVDDDSYMDFIVHFGKEAKWKAFKGNAPAPDTVPFWETTVSAASPPYAIIGNFEGNASRYFVTGQYRFWDDPDRYVLYFYRVNGGTITDSPVFILESSEMIDPWGLISPTDVRAIDLDKKSGDELVLSTGVTLREGIRSQVGEIWFYRGGKDFQVDQPTLVITDEEENRLENQYYLSLADFDGDSYIDAALGTQYRDNMYKLKFWFGREGSPWNWTNTPDRVVELQNSGLNHRLTLGNFDGDGIIDLAGNVYDGDLRHIHIYLSGSGKNFRERSLDRADADKILTANKLQVTGSQGGYLNDTSHRYEMLALTGPSVYHANDGMLALLSGGKNGPNGTWDAIYSPSRDGVTAGSTMRLIEPLGDCNGDGWPDLLMSDDKWYLFDHGIALVVSGGPEIPNDDPTVSVREVATQEHEAALHIWPNPVREKLNIVWRGDLRRMPSRFVVYDLLGQVVAEGDVDPGVGGATWNAERIASGTYLLGVFDSEGECIASEHISKP